MFLPGQEHCLRRNQRRNILWTLEYKDGLAIHGTMRASSPTISYQAFSGSDLIRLSEPPVHYGMIATGNHSDSDSLRGAPPRRGRLGKTDCDRHPSAHPFPAQPHLYAKIPYAIFRWHRGFFGLCYSLGGVQSPPPEPPPEPPEPEEPPLLLGMGVVRAVDSAI